MLECVKFLQDLLNTRQELEKMSKVVLIEQCSSVIIEEIEKKMGDIGSLTFLCEFGNAMKTFALADYGASNNLMSYSFYQKLCNIPKVVIKVLFKNSLIPYIICLENIQNTTFQTSK